jgi:hypothetical protein
MQLCKRYLVPGTLLDMILKIHNTSDVCPEREPAPGCYQPICSFATLYSYYHAELALFRFNCSRVQKYRVTFCDYSLYVFIQNTITKKEVQI